MTVHRFIAADRLGDEVQAAYARLNALQDAWAPRVDVIAALEEAQALTRRWAAAENRRAARAAVARLDEREGGRHA